MVGQTRVWKESIIKYEELIIDMNCYRVCIKQTNSQVLESTSEELLHSDAVRTDTVMISEEGRQASIQMRQQSVSVDSSSNNTIQQLQEDTSEETEYQTEDLSEYTDTELKQMYYRGEITLQEYEDETGEIIE